MPWSRAGELLLIYSYDPFVVIRVDTATGDCEEAVRWTPPFRADGWKGSTSPVHVVDRGRWLMMVHETNQQGGAVYSNRFVELSNAEGDLKITRFSEPFTFERPNDTGPHVEYVAGLARLPGTGWNATSGVEDQAAAWALVADETVDRLLAAREDSSAAIAARE